MSAAVAVAPARRWLPAVVLAVIALLAGPMTLYGLAAVIPPERWVEVFLYGRMEDMQAVVAWYSWAPRLFAALAAGAALGLAGSLLQLALRNPLAAPATLGVTAGAQLGLIAAALGLPVLGLLGREVAALAGGAAAAGLACAIGLRRGGSPVTLILAGLVVTLYLGAVGSLLLLFHREMLGSVFVWGAGSLAQHGWATTTALAWRLAAVGGLVALFWRGLATLEIPEAAHGLGVPVAAVRLLAITLAIVLSVSVTAGVGVISFVGLGAPALARLAGARRPAEQVVWASVYGAAVLWATDQVVQVLAGRGAESVPTGAATALVGGPLILLLLSRLRTGGITRSLPPARRVSGWPGRQVIPGLVLLVAVISAALLVGVDPAGQWGVPDRELLNGLMQWRWPRVVAAAGAGALFGIAGTAIQRMTGNPMASPEVTGISAGAALGLVLVIWLLPGAAQPLRLGAAVLGAVSVLGVIVFLGRGSAFAPERVLLAGVALAAFFDATITALLAFGDPRAGEILTWLSGSTYGTGPVDAAVVMAAAGLAAIAVLAVGRWLDLLPLGEGTVRALGMPLATARAATMGLVATTTAAATVALGPLSFVGLMAPHMARFRGLSRAVPQALGAALLGAILMVLADWLGRVVVFPRQVPAGLVAAMVGGPYLLWLMRRMGRR